MKLLIDCSNLFAGGGIQVATSFIYDLLGLDDGNIYYIIQSINSAKSIEFERFDDKRFIFFNLNLDCQKSIKVRKKQVKAIENQVKPDCIFTVFGPSYHRSSFPKVVGFAIPHLLYSDSPYFEKLSFKDSLKNYFLMNIKKFFFLKNSDCLIFETVDARNIFNSKNKNNIKSFIVNNTLNQIFLNEGKWKYKEFDIKADFKILCLTANYPHKNLNILPEVIDTLLLIKPGLEFKFVLSINKEELNLPDEYDEYIEYLGLVPLNEVPSLYKQIDMLFMPTLLEVFSTSYLEAMFMKKPIIASDMGFARDICGDSALYCDPINGEDYAKAIYKVIDDKKIQEELITKGSLNLERFGTSMDRTLKYLDILKIIVDANNKK